MELCKGDLTSLIENRVPFPHHEKVGRLTNTLLFHVLQALDYLRTKKLLHLDLTPANVLYTEQNKTYTFKLCDFGFMTQGKNTNNYGGTTVYMPPELQSEMKDYQGKSQTRADVWSTFAIIVEVMNVVNFRDVIFGKVPRKLSR